MPNIKTRITAVALAVGLSLGGAAYATAASQSNSSSAAPATTYGQPPATDARPDGGPVDRGHGGPGGGRLDTATLAKSLGVTEAKLKAALETIRSANGGCGDALATALAKELDLEATKVKSALEATRPDRP